MKFIDPRIDFAFKKIFGSEDTKEILISFLESLLGLEGDKRICDPEKMREKPFDKAFEKAMLANMTLEESEYYDKACMAVADARGAIELALEEGMEKERVIIARKMLKKGTDIEYISEITGFTLEQIQHL